MANKKMISKFFVICFAVLQLSHQATLTIDPYYTVGVVEYRPASSATMSSLERVEDNLSGYLEIIASNEALPTDIIIFPESTLNNIDQLTYIPDPAQLVVPCENTSVTDYHNFLVQLSCHAKKSSKYIVVNVSEKEDCSSTPLDPRPCASNGFNVYNTNVVFDRSGAVISRYRKVHLYGEPKNTTYQIEYGIFDTDFGVRFGHFICFDILFYTPAQEMVDKLAIKDFIFTSMWFSQLPFLTGVQIQSAWSYGNDVNLLAAGASDPLSGSTGTGIYAGRRGPLVTAMSQGEGQRRLYVERVTKYEHVRKLSKREINPTKTKIVPRLNGKDIFLKRDYLEHYESIILNLNQGNSLERKLCYNKSFCCHFELSWQHLTVPPVNSSTYYTYRLGAFVGWRNEAAAEVNKIKNCAIFACIGDDIMDCGKIFPDDVVDNARVQPQFAFERILIEASFTETTEFLLMPNSLRANDLLPVALTNFEWHESTNNFTRKVQFLLNTTTSDLLAFSIYGNYFNSSDDTCCGRGYLGNQASILLLLMSAVVTWTINL